MKIAVTGSNGFLASYFRKFTNISSDKIIYLTTSIKNKNFSKTEKIIKCETLYGDIEKKLRLQKINTIIHFASVIPKFFKNADDRLFFNNIEMMNNLYKFSVKNKLKKFIYLSGFGSMDHPENLDIKDFYTMSKITGEHFCSIMNFKKIDAVSLRISAPYGEYSKNKNVLNIFLNKALKNEDIIVYGKGSREQNFTYAGDILNALELILKKKISGTYNVTSNQNISMFNLAKLIKEITKSKSRIVFNNKVDPQESYRPKYNSKKAFKTFGYKSKFDLKDGLQKYINWYLQ